MCTERQAWQKSMSDRKDGQELQASNTSTHVPSTPWVLSLVPVTH